MKKTLLWVLLSIAFLAGCATPAGEMPELNTPTDTLPPKESSTPSPTEAPTQEPTLTSSPEPTQTPTPAVTAAWVAFLGQDGNVRLVDRLSGEILEVTGDATPLFNPDGGMTVRYWSPHWSSDGQMLAYQREVGEPMESGYNYLNELWVYELESGSNRQMMVDQRVVSTAWRPGTHWLAISFAVDEAYFALRGQVDSSKAKGIWAVDADTNETIELVPPQNGYALVNPQWSDDGRFLAFEEIFGYEGRGYFAYYDVETSAYISFNESVGFYDWSPDNQTLVYDTLTYVARGDERIFLRSLVNGESEQLSPDYAQGYAFYPRFSPSGDQVAYLAEIGAPESGQYTLYVQALAEGEPRELGTFGNGLYLDWLPDSSGLVLAAGPFEARQIFEVSLADGSSRLLAEGDLPALHPVQP